MLTDTVLFCSMRNLWEAKLALLFFLQIIHTFILFSICKKKKYTWIDKFYVFGFFTPLVWKTNGYPNRKSKIPETYQYGNYQLVFSSCFGIPYFQTNVQMFASRENTKPTPATLDKTVFIFIFSRFFLTFFFFFLSFFFRSIRVVFNSKSFPFLFCLYPGSVKIEYPRFSQLFKYRKKVRLRDENGKQKEMKQKIPQSNEKILFVFLSLICGFFFSYW